MPIPAGLLIVGPSLWFRQVFMNPRLILHNPMRVSAIQWNISASKEWICTGLIPWLGTIMKLTISIFKLNVSAAIFCKPDSCIFKIFDFALLYTFLPRGICHHTAQISLLTTSFFVHLHSEEPSFWCHRPLMKCKHKRSRGLLNHFCNNLEVPYNSHLEVVELFL